MKTTKEVLIEAKNLLVSRGWTQGALARNSAGEPCSWQVGKSLCAVGAVGLATDDCEKAGEAFLEAISSLLEEADGKSVAIFNDSANDVKEVFDLFDRAIQRCKS